MQWSLLLPFPCFFCFKQAGSFSMAANDDDNGGNGYGIPLLCNGHSFAFSWFFMLLNRQAAT